jgi:hypothetical protein
MHTQQINIYNFIMENDKYHDLKVLDVNYITIINIVKEPHYIAWWSLENMSFLGT